MPRHKWDAAIVALILRLSAEGRSQREIGIDLGVPRQSVGRILRRNGIASSQRGKRGPGHAPPVGGWCPHCHATITTWYCVKCYVERRERVKPVPLPERAPRKDLSERIAGRDCAAFPYRRK